MVLVCACFWSFSFENRNMVNWLSWTSHTWIIMIKLVFYRRKVDRCKYRVNAISSLLRRTKEVTVIAGLPWVGSWLSAVKSVIDSSLSYDILVRARISHLTLKQPLQTLTSVARLFMFTFYVAEQSKSICNSRLLSGLCPLLSTSVVKTTEANKNTRTRVCTLWIIG